MTLNSILLHDERRLSWREYGETGGRVILFCTGAGMSGALPFGLSLLKSLDIRLIVIDRPGLGFSDPHPNKTLDTWAADAGELLSQLRFRTHPIAVGFSQGAPFAYALANRKVVSALAIVSGQDDFSDQQSFALLPDQAREFIQSVRSGEEKFLTDFSRSLTAEKFFDLVLTMSSEQDRKIYSADSFKANYLKSLREGFSQGPEGYVQDLIATFSPWPFNLEDINVPVSMWYGAKDANPTHSPDHGLRASQRLPRAKRTVLENEGSSLLWTRAEDILLKLIRSA